MKAYVFPGQGAQFVGMGKDLYEKSSKAKEMFETANGVLGFRITDLMFGGTDEDLRQTKVTQPAIFLHSVILANILSDFAPDVVAGHSLGEFSALVANRTLGFEDGLKLVYQRALAMQEACEIQKGTMAAVLGAENSLVEQVCNSTEGIVVAANYNCNGQIVISGSVDGVRAATEQLKAAGVKRVLPLNVGGAFHSPLMEPARVKLAAAIDKTRFSNGICPIVQNVTGQVVSDPARIKENLIAQLTAPVRWTQTMETMINNGVDTVIEVGPGTVLQGLFRKTRPDMNLSSAGIE